MLYLFKVEIKSDNNIIYHLFETHTESKIQADDKLVIQLINNPKMGIKNMSIEDNKIQIKEWPLGINQHENGKNDRKSDYILLNRLNENNFKLFSCFTNETVTLSDIQLKMVIESNRIANCNCENEIYKSIDTYNVKTDKKFIEHIKMEYEKFRLKTLIFGMDIKFSFIIENEEVKLKKYTGKSKKVILPSFATALCDSALAYKGIQELTLNSGLRHIGNNAFNGNNIQTIELPRTVEFVGQITYMRNTNEMTIRKTYTKLNPDTILIN